MRTQEKIRLYGVDGIARRSGTDEHDAFFIEYDAEELETPDECAICGQPIHGTGWLCMDGGEVFCQNCVET